MSLKTVVIACHLYGKDAKEFKELCSEFGKFHSEVLRDLIVHYNKYTRKGWVLSNDAGWVRKTLETNIDKNSKDSKEIAEKVIRIID
ncbi:hypothetical protein ES705_35596 [subsurface metagenome]